MSRRLKVRVLGVSWVRVASLLTGAGVGETGAYRMVHADRRTQLAMVTSEPLTADATDWVPVPTNHMVVVTRDLHVLVAPVLPTVAGARSISASLEALTGM